MSRREIRLSERDVIRFWAKVDRRDGGCWIWTSAKLPSDYGVFMLPGNQSVRAHRVSMTIAHGPIPDGLDVCHTCDTPSCVNPDHLFLGTMRQNLADASMKGRCAVQRHPEIVRGERNGSAKLTEADVRIIRRKELSITETARQFGISVTMAKAIRNRSSWSHLSDD